MKYKREMFTGLYDYDDFVFFWGHRCSNPRRPGKACFSNFFPSPVTIDGQKYTCVEQYMHAMKADLFGDARVASLIRRASDPAVMKHLGREVRDFRKDVWDEASINVVYRGCLEKFMQHSELMDELLKTGDKILVEASPRDRIWGIGMGASNPDVCNPRLWRGTNYLGFTLMEVRDEIRERFC